MKTDLTIPPERVFCKDCHYFYPTPFTEFEGAVLFGTGECRGGLPLPQPKEYEISRWTTVRKDDWCGCGIRAVREDSLT